MTRIEQDAGSTNGQRGFTIAEALVATALVALLFVIILGGLRLGLDVWRRNSAALAGVNEISFAQGLLRRAIIDAYPSLTGDDPQAGVVDFAGTSTTLSFLAPAPQAAAAAGKARVSFRVTPEADGLSLVMEMRLANPAADGEDRVVVETLMRGMESFAFSYYPRNAPPDGLSWRAAWTNEARLPVLVKAEAVFPEGDARVWPVLIAAPRIDVDASCRYDRLTHYCQGRRAS